MLGYQTIMFFFSKMLFMAYKNLRMTRYSSRFFIGEIGVYTLKSGVAFTLLGLTFLQFRLKHCSSS